MSTKLGTVLADFTTQLTTQLAIGGTTATLASATDDDGVALPSGIYFFTLDGANSQKEHIVCTLSGTALTAISSVSRQGVQTAGAARLHRVGATVTLTDFAHLLYINNLLLGTTNLNAAVPLGYDGTASITTANQLATKAYVDGVVLAGGSVASTTTLGLVRTSAASSTVIGTVTMTIASPAVMTAVAHGLTVNDLVVFTTSGSLPTGIVAGTTYYVIATGLTADAFQVSASAGGSAVNTSGSQAGTHTLTKTTPIAIVDTDYRLNKNNYAADGGSNDTYVITLGSAPAAYAAGQIFQFKANTVNTGPCTLNVNSLGAKSLKMNSNLDPVDGYIKAGAIVTVLYDGTNFQILSVSGKPSVSQTGEELYAADGGSTDDYAVTLNPVPVAYVTGMTVRFKANTVNTGPATLNVNALGAKSIVKYVNTALANADIAAGMFCTVIYDGTNFVLQNPIGNVPQTALNYSNGTLTLSASGTTTITPGFQAKAIRIHGVASISGNGGNGNFAYSNGGYDSTTNTNKCVYYKSNTNVQNSSGIQTTKAYYIWCSNNAADNGHDGIINNITATTFDIVNTLSGGSVVDASIFWEAIG